jgi:hypothetical protein
MVGIYCADAALGIAIGEALSFYGLDANPAAVNDRPQPARTFAEQMQRIDVAGKVLARIRTNVPVGMDDRRLIERLVDSACQRIENANRPATSIRQPVADSVVIAYAAAGGGECGSFESFRRRFLSGAELLEPAVDRQDVRPAPLTTNPHRRTPATKPPGSSSPVKTNPTRAIRSSRWTAGRKAVRS